MYAGFIFLVHMNHGQIQVVEKEVLFIEYISHLVVYVKLCIYYMPLLAHDIIQDLIKHPTAKDRIQNQPKRLSHNSNLHNINSNMQFKIYTVAISTLKTYYNSIFHSVRLLYTLSRRI